MSGPESSKAGHRPVRMCIICRKRFFKAELTRYVAAADNPKQDPAQILTGRGFYVCDGAECGKKLQKRLSRGKGGTNE